MSIKTNKYAILVVLGLFTGVVNSLPYIDNSNSSINEKLNLQKTDDLTEFEIINPKIGKCLSPKNKLSKLGTKVVFENCENNDQQQWSLSDSDKVVHNASHKCLVTLGNDPTLTLWSCNARKSLHRGRVNFVAFPNQPIRNANVAPCKELIAVSYKSQTIDYNCNKVDKSNDWLVRTVNGI